MHILRDEWSRKRIIKIKVIIQLSNILIRLSYS